MSTRSLTPAEPSLDGRTVVITRPAGTGSPLARRVRRMGGVPLLLPGLSLRAVDGAAAVAVDLRAALNDQLLIFTSPAAVRFAAHLAPLRTDATVLAVGQGTARALARHGVDALAPLVRQDSEGLLEQPALAHVQGRRVALIGAPGGRGVLRAELLARGAQLREVHVYRRGTPRWQRRQLDAVRQLPADARVLLSSAEALDNLQQGLPADAFAQLIQAVAIASSERLAEAAHAAGFERVAVAASALSDNLLTAAARP
ncbi:uroporphyrinogen-III synthase [Dyella japonica]|uniref:Uroporphyrinogen-III synthase n=1 Tax=Dyella japonica DSM 16301 TaxID=1440762 RepID=A0A0G9H852_9GAMM|nr:uroporphyrinogen-III synthase [Dyella japonica]KLD65773.1 uroporphyrinogen III synthase [Dyella japonica DSM 16301]